MGGAHHCKKKKDKGKGAELPGTGATGSVENKDEETAAKHIQDAFNKDGTVGKSKSEPPASKDIKATGKKKAKGKTAKKDELAPLGAVENKKDKKGNDNAEVAAKQIQHAFRKRVGVNLEKKEELPATKAIGCSKNQDEQAVGKPVPGAHHCKKKKDKGKGAELPGTGATGSVENKDEETAAKHIQDAFNKDGTVGKFKSEPPPASKDIKATGKKEG